MVYRNKIKGKQTSVNFGEKIIDLYIIAVLSIFPLYFTNAYHNILVSKYYFYIASVIALTIAFVILALIKRKSVAAYFRQFRIMDVFHRFTVTDTALCAFIIIAAVSTVTSDYLYESFWGNEGRYSGLFLLGLYCIAYFILSRFGKIKKWYLNAFLISGAMICLLGICDYFHMDVLGFKVTMKESEKNIFTSTIGNINTYTAIVGMYTAVSAVLFACERNKVKCICYAASLIINLFALIMGISDNAYLSLGILLALLPFYLFKNYRGIKKYIVILAIFFTVVQCIDWINSSLGDRVVGIDGAFNIITGFSGLLLVVIALWLLVIAIHFLLPSFKTEGIKLKWPGYLWAALLVLCFSFLCFIFWDANFAGNAARYEALRGYVVFNDDWGTHRGYIWRNAMECYQNFSPWKKLVGFGPDTFGIVLLDKTANNIYRQTFDNAHNEYLHYLITVGFAGLLAYMIFLISFCVRIIRRLRSNGVAVAILFAVVCYLTQAFVNLNLPISTPLLWTLLALGTMKGDVL